jgi:benzoate 4-monooxygenase
LGVDVENTDVLPTGANYLAFDIVGDLAFGEPFGMLDSAQDLAHIPADASTSTPQHTPATLSIPAIKILNGRGEYSLSTGVLPAWWRPFVRHLIPWYKRGSADVKTLAGIAIVAVARRLAAVNPSERVDLLSRLMEGLDAQGEKMGREEVTAEALTFLIAGSDTTSKYVSLFPSPAGVDVDVGGVILMTRVPFIARPALSSTT